MNLLEKYQVHSHSKTCRKYDKDKSRFGFGKFFCKETIISEPLPEALNEVEVYNLLVEQNNIFSKVQDYISANLNPRKTVF